MITHIIVDVTSVYVISIDACSIEVVITDVVEGDKRQRTAGDDVALQLVVLVTHLVLLLLWCGGVRCCKQQCIKSPHFKTTF